MKIVAVTACPTGIAHTYMAAEALEQAGKKMDIEIKVETQGSVGAENELTPEDIASADAVIIAADTKVSRERFQGKPIVEVGVKAAIDDAEALIKKAQKAEVKETDASEQVFSVKEERSSQRQGAYKHLMTGVSHMIPFVVAGGIAIALSFAFGINAAEVEGSLASALMRIGGNSAFALMVPILAGYIAYSIADRPGLVPGMVGGMLASSIGAGFLGGIVAGFLAGYTVQFLAKNINLPKNLQGLMPVLVLPLLSTLFVGLMMIYVIGTPVSAINSGLNNWLTSMSDSNAIILGIVIGLMMAFDMGGPVNKAAYTFGVGTLGTLEPGQTSAVMGAVMAAGMVPPLGLALATTLFKSKFNRQEVEAGKAAWALGISFITEGAIPFAAADPFRVIPSIMLGSAVTGAITMAFNVGISVPHGGIFVLPIPNAVSNLGIYGLAIAVGMVVTAFAVSLLKPTVE
jgi:PTS system fructose-specific IIC component